MPGNELYTLSAMTLMKRGDGCCNERTITGIAFDFSNDDGNTWIQHENGKYFPTGSLPTDQRSKERYFEIHPPIVANMFRMRIDRAW